MVHTQSEIPSDIAAHVQLALAEDIGSGDITARLIGEDTQARARIICREPAVLCGIPWANEVLRQVSPAIQADWQLKDGEELVADQLIVRLTGPARALLTAERSMLNYLQTLSGTATLSRQYASLVGHTAVQLLDTRKTLPGLRSAQKYAVRVGGCSNHRMGLWDAFLIKENHINASGSITRAIAEARRIAPGKPVEVEVENLKELEEALEAAADIVMLDNFTATDMRQAVRMNQARLGKACKLEASGGITRDNLVDIAETGVDYISIGALTKDVRAIDLSMRFDSMDSGLSD
ncbi:carboxylating nicotinate-nucleotide diphosphorylase [Pseudohongiella spirulinae]|uniref:Probable nicotinate-nucleotide pyrophosphorylase [carboxylating] n=1 Tax=Pseudohongiella spirulinae TaxID=1249552 RepID=A0A0S2KF09_9GAMM|nr:carboxylating nicotinate-nucleotide diphosphorylase [Pseudohongiella spirulinae]ALO46912.1 Quinolinate phosphoribosyltransferase [Pseudohongiella spirulinae]